MNSVRLCSQQILNFWPYEREGARSNYSFDDRQIPKEMYLFCPHCLTWYSVRPVLLSGWFRVYAIVLIGMRAILCTCNPCSSAMIRRTRKLQWMVVADCKFEASLEPRTHSVSPFSYCVSLRGSVNSIIQQATGMTLGRSHLSLTTAKQHRRRDPADSWKQSGSLPVLSITFTDCPERRMSVKF